ncbi:MAG: GMC family oxidoreductase [Reyranella sp.]|nr:MAG: GMC family oxidoreductase [Reyranella sp.]
MPFIDANQALLERDWTGFDITIVGAGAAGIMLAVLLGRRGKRVLLLDSGHLEFDDEKQTLNDIEQSAKPLGNAIWNRRRVIGGTTTAWGGQSLPFGALDFEARDWVPGSGWPLSLDTLAPYYIAANRFMGIDGENYDTDILRLLKRQAPPVDPELLSYHYSKWARQPDFHKLHRADLERHVTVLYNAHLTRIDLGEDDRARAIEVSDFRERRRSLPVATLAVAAGGIETNRILLLNDHQKSGGLGNHSGWLGKAFFEHPSTSGGTVETDDPMRLQQYFAVRLRRRTRYSVRLSASRPWQERNRLLNASAGLIWSEEEDYGPLSILKRFVARPTPGDALQLARMGGPLAESLWILAREGLVYRSGASARLGLVCEQAPSRNSYIALGASTDRFGLRKARLHWRIGHDTWATAVRFAHTIAAELERLKLGRLHLPPELRLEAEDYEDHLHDANHHMGGARMSAAAADGVVDDRLRLWGVPNLYVCSAAVFPTGSHSNPTLTLLALVGRLADDLAPA